MKEAASVGIIGNPAWLIAAVVVAVVVVVGGAAALYLHNKNKGDQ